MTKIIRSHTNARMSQAVRHGTTLYLAGQVGEPGQSVADQTRSCLRKIEALLAENGSDSTKILQCIIWMADMADFAEMNDVWDAWVPEGAAPARASGEAKLASPEYLVELIVIAACENAEETPR